MLVGCCQLFGLMCFDCVDLLGFVGVGWLLFGFEVFSVVFVVDCCLSLGFSGYNVCCCLH